MRQKTMARTLVSLTAAVGIAAGGLAGAGTAFAAPVQKAPSAVSADVGALAVVNLGLSKAQAQNVQRSLKSRWQYSGSIDGQLGTNSWKAMQRFLRSNHGYRDSIDGIVGPNTVKALQRFLKEFYGYRDSIDGVAGPNTKAAFKRMSGYCPNNCLIP
ncbi:peptidoglycan-binding protein [Streptomyces sp. NPDC048142]|uniref:peptidoglycan-binding domain-containing protein n=1 Tax=Streptomyces sp. NPDC048142 TaxID=3365501 RepID=UPI0037215845